MDDPSTILTVQDRWTLSVSEDGFETVKARYWKQWQCRVENRGACNDNPILWLIQGGLA